MLITGTIIVPVTVLTVQCSLQVAYHGKEWLTAMMRLWQRDLPFQLCKSVQSHTTVVCQGGARVGNVKVICTVCFMSVFRDFLVNRDDCQFASAVSSTFERQQHRAYFQVES